MSKNKKTSKILYSICFVFLSALSILGLVKALDDGGKIEISKKATKIYGEDNNNLEYGRKARVTLDVNALPYNESNTTNGKLDIILILDRSGSMSEGVNGQNDHTKSRLNLVKEASDIFINTIMSENNNVKLGVVDYSTGVRSHNMTTDKNIALGYNDNLEASGATNIQEAIKEAHNLLDDQGRDDAKKIIILLTDGIPTKFRYNGIIYGNGDNDDSVCVYKTFRKCRKEMRPSEAAKNELDNFKSSYPKADVYTITFGNESEAANKLQTINPEEITKDHVYENTLSLNAEELNKKFQSITESIQNVIGKNAVVTDIIPNTFELTESSIKDLESKGVNIVTNSEGEQVLTWNIGNINANNKITLEYEVIAKDEFHGNMFTNTNAVLNVEVSDNNPYYEGTKQTLTFEKPTVEIPAITNNDSYKTNSSYITKEGETLTGTTILNNDINKQILTDKNNTDVNDEIIIIENENTVKKEDGSYELYKNKEFYGVLTLNSDGTFSFESIKGQTGEISFDYKIKSNIKNGSETDKVYSNKSTVTLNILEIEKTTISGTKTWVDDNNRDGLRPNSITVYLYANGKEFDKKLVSEETNWSYEFKDLYTEEHDKKIVYEVREEKVEGYDSEVLENGNIINTHEVEKTSVSGIKKWVDDNNRDGIRPDEITVNLYANGSKIDSKKVSIDNNWKYTFDDLYKNENGKEIKYTIDENKVDGYNTSYDGFNITNTHESEKININVSKNWVNNNNLYGHDDNINVNIKGLVNNVSIYEKNITLNEQNNWSESVKDLYKYNNGIEINYVITEESIKDYDVTYNDTLEGNNRNIIITNTYNPEVTDITITKTWIDDNNRDGIRPNSIEFELYAYCDNEIVHKYKQTMNDSWSYTFTNLPVYANGSKIKYIVDEKLVDGYTKEINGFNIINMHEIVTTNISGTKTWEDDNDRDGIRPDNIKVNLYGNDTLIESKEVSANDNWKYEFINLPVNANGNKIEYRVDEESVNNYSKSIDGFNITNTHEIEKTSIKVTKTWVDDNNRDGLRPDNIKVFLISNDEIIKTVDLDENNNWEYEFNELPVNENGNKIEYRVDEESVKNYSKSINGFNITNTHEIETTSISGTKTWNDENNNDGKRPGSITINLLANNEIIKSKEVSANDNWTYEFTNLPVNENGNKIIYSVNENEVENYKSEINGYNLTNTHESEKININVSKEWINKDNIYNHPDNVKVKVIGTASGNVVYEKELTLNNDNNWKQELSNLYKYNKGELIAYEVTESAVKDYDTLVTNNGYNFTITNTYNPEVTDITITKTWIDDNNRDGIRPDSIELELYAYCENKILHTYKQTMNDSWSYTFTNLPVYANGSKIKYIVDEKLVNGYTKEINGFNIINKHNINTTSISGTKTWIDDNNRDGLRPDSIKVNLYGNNELVETKKVSANDNWKYEFTNLPVKDNGEYIEYRVDEELVDNYSKSIDGFNITNTHEVETISISGVKTWKDDNNRDGLRPDSINVYLYSNDKLIQTKVVSGDFTYEFVNLPKYENGKEIKYTIDENEVDGYKKFVDGYNLINTHEIETTSISGTKTWEDDNNRDGLRPNSIEVNLYGNDKLIETKEVSADSNWTYEFTNLPVKDNGKKIEYRVDENEVQGYTGVIDGYNITNKHNPITKTIKGSKLWVDQNNKDGLRPESITIKLFGNDKLIETKEVSANSNWTYEFSNLLVYENGEPINYYVREEEVDKYTTTYDGFDIINTHTPKDITVSGTKTWIDKDNRYGHPSSIKVNLQGKVGDKVVVEKQLEVKELDDWKYEFNELPEYFEGKLIDYTISEDAVKDYDTTINGFDIINTYNPETINISGQKTWEDDNNRDGIRPDSIKVNLYNNDILIETKEVSANDNWTYEFTNLPKYANGQIINYSIKETDVSGYVQELDEYNIINNHSPEKVNFNVKKVWNDDNNNDGIRPDSIRVVLYANGNYVTETTISEENDWTYEFNDLFKYENGQIIEYKIVEDEVKGYISSYETIVNDDNKTDIIITNSHENETIDLEINKIWDDKKNIYNTRPDHINVDLYENGILLDNLIITKESDWKLILNGLQKYKNGIEIEYTVIEKEVENYESFYRGTNIYNRLNKNFEQVNNDYVYMSYQFEEIPPMTGIENKKTNIYYLLLLVTGMMFSIKKILE